MVRGLNLLRMTEARHRTTASMNWRGSHG
jgi:hypothetical protein